VGDAASARPADGDLWRVVEATVYNVILPSLDDPWARAAAVQLVGVARYAQRRDEDPTAANAAEVAAVIAGLTHNPLVVQPLADDPHSVLDAAARSLAAAVADAGADGDEVRAVLRPLLVRQLDDELAITAPLVAAFRGQLDE